MMKKSLLLGLVVVFTFHLSPFTLQAQGQPAVQRHTVNFEGRDGESFSVFVDGDVVNRMPQSRVTVHNVSSQTHEVVVVMKQPEQKAAVLQLLPGEPVVTVYVDYDERVERLLLYTPSYNLTEKNNIDYGEMQEAQGEQDEQATDSAASEVKTVTAEDLAAMLLRMKGQRFDSDRLELGKVIVASSSLTAEQIGRLATAIDYSASQVEFLKYAYGYCRDPKNYYKAIDVLTFNSDKRKVMDFIATQ